MKCIVVSVVALAFTAFASPVQALLIESFEDGLTDWKNFSQSSQGATILGSQVDRHGTVYLPTDGDSFLRLRAGTPSGLPAELDFQTRITSRAITVNPGETIHFDSAWIGNDHMPYNDSAWVRMLIEGQYYPVPLGSIQWDGNYTSTAWRTHELLVGQGTSVTIWLEFFVRNDRDSAGSSYLLLDNIRTYGSSNTAVPEPASVMLLMSSLGLLVAKRSRRPVV